MLRFFGISMNVVAHTVTIVWMLWHIRLLQLYENFKINSYWIVEWNINNILVNSQRKNLMSGFIWQWMLGVQFLEY